MHTNDRGSIITIHASKVIRASSRKCGKVDSAAGENMAGAAPSSQLKDINSGNTTDATLSASTKLSFLDSHPLATWRCMFVSVPIH